MMKGKQLDAVGLRFILIATMFLIAIITGVLINYTIGSQLKPYAIDVSHAVVDSNASQDNVQKLQSVQKELIDNKDAIDRASSIVADSQSYQYQDQILTDINNYANKSGITVTNIDFSAGSASSTASSSTTTPKVSTPSTDPNGVKSTPVSVTIKNPVNYDSLLRFIHSIEQNLTKMQISKVSLAKGSDGGISSEVLTLEVYIR